MSWFLCKRLIKVSLVSDERSAEIRVILSVWEETTQIDSVSCSALRGAFLLRLHILPRCILLAYPGKVVASSSLVL